MSNVSQICSLLCGQKKCEEDVNLCLGKCSKVCIELGKSINNKLNVEKAIYKICDKNIKYKYNYYDLYYSNYYIGYRHFEDEFKKELEKKFSNEAEYLDYILKLVDTKIENRDISLSSGMAYSSIIISIITLLDTVFDSKNNSDLILLCLLEVALIYIIITYSKTCIKDILKLKNFKRYLENEIGNINKIEENQK